MMALNIITTQVTAVQERESSTGESDFFLDCPIRLIIHKQNPS